jgi:hypothetical protein
MYQLLLLLLKSGDKPGNHSGDTFNTRIVGFEQKRTVVLDVFLESRKGTAVTEW